MIVEILDVFDAEVATCHMQGTVSQLADHPAVGVLTSAVCASGRCQSLEHQVEK
jgi:hypothetical protein